MVKRRKFRCLIVLFFCAVLLFHLCACDTLPTDSASSQLQGESAANVRSAQAGYLIPELLTAEFHQEQAETEGGVSIDLSALSVGYVAVSAYSEKDLKFQAICGECTYNYNLPGDGTPAVIPLNMGSGSYQFRVMEQVEGSKYAQLWTRSCDVVLSDEFQPFLRQSQMVPYSPDSQCVTLAQQLASGCEDDVQVVSAIYNYLVEQIIYDGDKAATVSSDYLPDPDQTLLTGTGICFDYAALAAAMLRSVGIPCKLITGYVEPGNVYHAWNEIYVQSQGWITVEISTDGNSWKRVDITFAANGVTSEQTDDDRLYTKRYTY